MAYIIMADDHEMVRRVMSRLLRKIPEVKNQGIEIVSAEDGQQALDHYLTDPASRRLVVTDRQMPVMNGYDFATKVRENDQDVPIIMVSGGMLYDDEKLAYEIGINRVFSKPYDIHEFTSTLNDYLTLDDKVEQPL